MCDEFDAIDLDGLHGILASVVAPAAFASVCAASRRCPLHVPLRALPARSNNRKGRAARPWPQAETRRWSRLRLPGPKANTASKPPTMAKFFMNIN